MIIHLWEEIRKINSKYKERQGWWGTHGLIVKVGEGVMYHINQTKIPYTPKTFLAPAP